MSDCENDTKTDHGDKDNSKIEVTTRIRDDIPSLSTAGRWGVSIDLDGLEYTTYSNDIYAELNNGNSFKHSPITKRDIVTGWSAARAKKWQNQFLSSQQEEGIDNPPGRAGLTTAGIWTLRQIEE